ncbi:flagellar hook-associated protein 3 [Desulfitobacterium dichloroeliminans LMG P-21439]|uniref:Flagellar hook-associated protein 3 n=1 Tax=Desulfitobacterium dichloroeliminans (strain LMG P-21439 / DCA1) TaxID=871963 RepID=L0FBB5_DESDL|nr:flagellar hook-associated protein FlgL [Desulfitobacterium dichloroeliminans]AGA70320.1 flagellar hook-associated protein 3 [Desulfitobacterium dichloroeliminans LMG P-21439]
MRVTNNMLSNNLLRNLNSAQGQMEKLQNQMGSGRRITRPSDDPVGIENALRYKSSISHMEQWKNNAKEGTSYLDTVDETLGEMTLMIQRAKELALQGANGTNTIGDQKKMAIEIKQIKEQLMQFANTRVGTKYVFGGTANEEPYPPGAIPGVTQWAGSDDVMKFQVGSNLSIDVSVNGRKLFGVDPLDTTQIGMFKILEDLSLALETSDQAGIQASISALENQSDSIIDFRAELGARQNRMDSIVSQLDATASNLSNSLANVLYVDMAEALIDFKTTENVYQAALSVGAKIIQPSLVDFMR